MINLYSNVIISQLQPREDENKEKEARKSPFKNITVGFPASTLGYTNQRMSKPCHNGSHLQSTVSQEPHHLIISYLTEPSQNSLLLGQIKHKRMQINPLYSTRSQFFLNQKPDVLVGLFETSLAGVVVIQEGSTPMLDLSKRPNLGIFSIFPVTILDTFTRDHLYTRS